MNNLTARILTIDEVTFNQVSINVPQGTDDQDYDIGALEFTSANGEHSLIIDSTTYIVKEKVLLISFSNSEYNRQGDFDAFYPVQCNYAFTLADFKECTVSLYICSAFPIVNKSKITICINAKEYTLPLIIE